MHDARMPADCSSRAYTAGAAALALKPDARGLDLDLHFFSTNVIGTLQKKKAAPKVPAASPH